MTQATDDSLIDRINSGDESALQHLYDRYGALLYTVALRIVGDPRNAEEVLQDSFVQLWRKASLFDSARGSLIGWLLTITRRRALSRVRQKDIDLSSNGVCDLAEIVRMGSTALEEQIARELVSAALSGLSRAQSEAITLAYFDGMTCEEIATRTKAPMGTVKSRMRSAFQIMKRNLSRPSPSARSKRIPGAITLEDILITEHLYVRPCKPRDPQKERKALGVLTHVAAVTPHQLIDAFLQLAIDLCNAGTCGLSFLETGPDGEQLFRWTNLAGILHKHVGGTTPRNFSPCGVTLDCDSPQLFAYPGRYFQYFNAVETPIVEGLVIPFHVGVKTEGTLWIVSHEENKGFDCEDARIMISLAEFVGCALRLKESNQ